MYLGYDDSRTGRILATNLRQVVVGERAYEPDEFGPRLAIAKAYDEPKAVLPIAEAMHRLIQDPHEVALHRSWRLARQDKTHLGYLGLLRGIGLAGDIEGVAGRTYGHIIKEAEKTAGRHPYVERAIAELRTRL